MNWAKEAVMAVEEAVSPRDNSRLWMKTETTDKQTAQHKDNEHKLTEGRLRSPQTERNSPTQPVVPTDITVIHQWAEASLDELTSSSVNSVYSWVHHAPCLLFIIIIFCLFPDKILVCNIRLF